MDGTGDAAIAVGAARATIVLPFSQLILGKWAIGLCWWGGACLILAGVAYLVIKWWRSYGGRALLISLPIQRWPDFQKWDGRSEFALYEAAALWFDAEPRLPMWWRARRTFRRWQRSLADTTIPAGPLSRGGPSQDEAYTISSVTLHTRVHREALKRLAEKEGREPLFLFRERRGQTLPSR
jgi:hypothetical protein